MITLANGAIVQLGIQPDVRLFDDWPAALAETSTYPAKAWLAAMKRSSWRGNLHWFVDSMSPRIPQVSLEDLVYWLSNGFHVEDLDPPWDGLEKPTAPRTPRHRPGYRSSAEAASRSKPY